MPRREIDPEVYVNTNAKKAKPKAKPRAATNGHKLPEPLPEGMVVTDVLKCKWKLGKSIGVGGFGEIYLASNDINGPVGANAPYVMKIEHHNNGPLFAEIHFYHRVGKEQTIQDWVKTKKQDYLGMPRFVASGSHEHKNIKYRFMVMDRFGEDLQKILNRSKNQFSLKTVYVLGTRIIDILEYVHSLGYIHADVKASNLLLGFGEKNNNKVFLIDFGLACRYIIDGKHKEYKEDLRKAHDGTIEFTSRDAHIGAHSRRGDLEILGYNMLQWLCKRLPWEDNLADPEYVSHQKNGFMSSIPQLMKKCFPDKKAPEGISIFLQYIANLKFDEEPNYNYCREIFRDSIKKGKMKLDMKLSFTPTPPKITGKASKRTKASAAAGSSSADVEDDESPTLPKGRRKHKIDQGSNKDYSSFSDDDSKQADSSLENPTPAMLQVMQRRLELQKQQRVQKKKLTPHESDRESANRIVRKYREKSPSPDVFEEEYRDTTKQPRSKDSSHRVRRMPLATCSSQAAPTLRRKYSPEV